MQSPHRAPRRRWAAALAAAAFALFLSLALAACGSSESTTGTSSSGDTGSSSQLVKEAQAAVTELAKSPGSYHEPPDSGVAPAADKDVWLISVGNEVDAVAESSRYFLEGAEALGWNGKVYDGKLQPTEWLAGVRQAVQAGADAIVLVAIDCAPVKQGLVEAKEKGIPVVSIEGFDCSELGQGGPQLFSFRVGFSEGSFPQWQQAWGKAQADFTIAETDGKAKIVYLRETDVQATKLIADQYAESIEEKCPECEILEKIDFVGTELGPELQEQVQQSLLKNPDATVVYANYDGPIVASVAPAVRAAGKTGMLVIGGEGSKPNLDLIRQGEQSMALGYVDGWESYASLDALNSIFAGKKPIEDSGMGVLLIDKEHNLPAAGEGTDSQLPFDWQQVYEKGWRDAK